MARNSQISRSQKLACLVMMSILVLGSSVTRRQSGEEDDDDSSACLDSPSCEAPSSVSLLQLVQRPSESLREVEAKPAKKKKTKQKKVFSLSAPPAPKKPKKKKAAAKAAKGSKKTKKKKAAAKAGKGSKKAKKKKAAAKAGKGSKKAKKKKAAAKAPSPPPTGSAVPAPGPAPPAMSNMKTLTKILATTTPSGIKDKKITTTKPPAPYKSTTANSPKIKPIKGAKPLNPDKTPKSISTAVMKDCILSAWQEWGDCSMNSRMAMVTPTQERRRIIVQPWSVGGKPCTAMSEVRDCLEIGFFKQR
eukprot:TRINITY_DN550_c0_g1_i2.p1 TRINITY_DN550_c0_g1~~TRINITY_DN550_c0_g1_i2.p1  ORF type:complete len:326 (+),score=69.69 TRINITY_DN550_c0_g1_i2:69-980(+)